VKFGAIDIGSNAVRLLIEEAIIVEGKLQIRKISLNRVPIRLGEDVFSKGKISKTKKVQLGKAMLAFWHLMDVHEIIYYQATATSAMREAENGPEIIQYLQDKAEIQVQVIDGVREAELIFSNFKRQRINLKGNYLYIDVGGGSTEVTLIKKGVRLKSHSFSIGTVRMLKGKVSNKEWGRAKDWIQELVKREDHLIAIGTGGNIIRIFKESGKKYLETIKRKEIKEVHDFIKSHTMEERLSVLLLKPDRADVIIPAGEIYIRLMGYAQIEEMIVPRVGLSDGLVLEMAKNWMKGKLDAKGTPRLR
jgi:exopolyphosphatase / guanosine-5'-triphosphate,3'-diphosphate pyrophosphatase